MVAFDQSVGIKLALFAVAWFLIIYAINCIIAGTRKRLELKQSVMYFATVAMIGVFGEIFLDSLYKLVVGNPLWRYNILPIHNAYTSTFAPIIWGVYGLHLYMLHDTLAGKWKIKKPYTLALIFCIEALVIESAVTISAKFVFGEFMYYYYPGDLWHVTSVQNIPFYFICGLVIMRTIRHFRTDPYFFAAMSAALTFVVVVLA